MNKILVLCSGGLDSTTLLYKAVHEVGAENVTALNIYYGQKHDKEQEYAEYHCKKLGVELITRDLSSVFTFSKECSLLKDSNNNIPHESYDEQSKKNKTLNTYVPYRNGLFLSYATAIAIQKNCDTIYYGAHKDDACNNAYPDCSQDFITCQQKAIFYGSGESVVMEAPWGKMNKSDIVATGLKIGMTEDDFHHTWSCYEGGEKPCGVCGTCIDRKIALENNGITE